MYVAELAEAKIRGTLGTFFQLQITVGLLIGYVLGIYSCIRDKNEVLDVTSSFVEVIRNGRPCR